MENSKSTKSNTGYKNINFRKDTGKFEAYLQYRMKCKFNKKPVKFSIGNYDTLKEAIKAREEFIKSLF